jgi:rod shape-determining protein MreC
VLVITQASDQMPPKAQQDLAQSAAEGAALGKQRASDILAERLPGLNDPSALADPGPGQKPAAAATVPAPLHPPPTLHADHFSPQATPPATALTPGQTIVDPKYAPAPKAQPDSAPAAAKPSTDSKTTVSKKPEPGGDATAQPTPNSALAKPKRLATNPVVPGDAATPGTTHPPVVKPKTPKPAVPDQPAATPAPPADGGQPQ